MLYDGIRLLQGTDLENLLVPRGTSFPLAPTAGELFFRTDQTQLYVYSGATWVQSGGEIDFSGLNVKAAARVATTGAITLSGTQTIDGVAVIAGDRVLVKNQGTPSQNGVYVVAAGAWTRATDFDGSPANEVKAGDFIFVNEGSTNADTGWVLTTNGTITIGTTALAFAQFTGANAVPGGVTNSLQYNSAGVFAGGTNLTWNNSTKTMSIGADLGDGTTHVQIGNASDSASGIHFRPRGAGYAYISVDEGTSSGSDLFISAGDALQTGSQPGGNLTLAAGKGGPSSGGANAGASVYIDAGTRGSINGVGGSIIFRGGNGASVVEQVRIANTGALSFGSSGNNFGSNGQVLTSSGSGSAPTWQNVTNPASSLLSGNNTWTGTNSFTASTFSLGGTGTSSRILADFSSTAGTRTYFQTFVVNGTTNVGFIPNGTGTRAQIVVFNSSAVTTGDGYCQFISEADRARIDSGIIGASATALPITISFQNVEAFRISANGSVSFGSSGTATGTVGQVLVSNGSAASPSWQDNAPTRVPRATSFSQSLADRGKRIVISAGVTLPASVYSGGDAFSFYNSSASPITITQGSGLTLRQDGTANTGNRTLAAYGTCFVWYNTASEAVITGSIT